MKGIPIPESVREEYVFPVLAATRVGTYQYLRAWRKRAGLDKPVGWHTARHTFATLALEGGADFFTVSKLLGHTKPATTAVYAKATDRLKREVVEGLPEIHISEDGSHGHGQRVKGTEDLRLG